AEARRLPARGSANGSDAVEQPREVIEQAGAELRDLVGGQPAEVTLKGLRPAPERCRLSQWVGARREADDAGMAPSKELAGEARLADARVRKQQDDAEFSGGGALKLPPELRQLGTSPYQLGRPGHRRNYPPGGAGGATRRSG